MTTGTSAPTGRQAGDGVKQKGQEAAGQAQEKAQHAAVQAKTKLREQLDQRSSQVAKQINQQASDLRAVSDSLRQQGKDGPAKAADRLAEYAEKAGGYLRDKGSDALLCDVEDVARRQPWAVGAGALVLGFAASRFLKASSRKRYSSRAVGQPGGTPGEPTRAAIPQSSGPPPEGGRAAGSASPPGSTPPVGV